MYGGATEGAESQATSTGSGSRTTTFPVQVVL